VDKRSAPNGRTGSPDWNQVPGKVSTIEARKRYLLAAHPHLLSPVLQVINRAISTFLIKQSGLKRTQAATGAVTLIQRFGAAANLDKQS
jgi:hypothetical protein